MSRVRTTYTKCIGMPLAYPISTVWAAGAIAASGVSRNWFDLATGLIGLTLVSVVMFIAVMRRELEVVHGLVNGQRDILLERIDTLVEYLVAAGKALPPGESEEGTNE